MTVGSSRSAAQIVVKLCELQRRLVERFMEDLRPMDLERFSDVAREGILQLEGQTWRYVRHGAGVLFEARDAVVDAHVGIALFPDAVDGWRLCQYLESIGVGFLAFDGELVPSDDEKSLEHLLERMARAGILEEAHLQPPTRLFRPARSTYAPS